MTHLHISTTVTCNSCGQMTGKTVDGISYRYEYDADGEREEIVYDGLGR